MNEKTQTVTKEKETTKELVVPFPSSLEEIDTLSFKITGQSTDRSYEDREVFLEIKSDTLATKEGHAGNLPIDAHLWLRAEKAIELGTRLIEAGNFAFKSNMYNHQRLHHAGQLNTFIEEQRVKSVDFKAISRHTTNHGDGYYLFEIKPIWKEDQAPPYQKDFSYEDVLFCGKDLGGIYYKNAVKAIIGSTPYDLIDALSKSVNLRNKQ